MTPVVLAAVVVAGLLVVVVLLALRARSASSPPPAEPTAEPAPTPEPTVRESKGTTVFSGMRIVAANPKGPMAGTCFSVGQDGALIGRDLEKCQIVYDNEKVSREHARLAYGPNGLVLTNMSKTNLTYLNDSAVQEAIVRPGDRIRISDVTFVVQMDG